MNEACYIGSTTTGPRYMAVQHEIVNNLMQGERIPGQAIPNEFRLVQRYRASIGTSRKVIEGMVAASILIRHPGRDYTGRVYG